MPSQLEWLSWLSPAQAFTVDYEAWQEGTERVKQARQKQTGMDRARAASMGR